MARRGHRDPTAEAAIGNVTKAQKSAAPRRKIVAEFPEAFADLGPIEQRLVALKAGELADGDVWTIKEHHLEQARSELFDGPSDVA